MSEHAIQLWIRQSFFPHLRIEGFLVSIHENGAQVLVDKKHEKEIKKYIPKPWMMYIDIDSKPKPMLSLCRIVEYERKGQSTLAVFRFETGSQTQQEQIRAAISAVRTHASGAVTQPK